MKYLVLCVGLAGFSGCVTVSDDIAEGIRYRETERINYFLDYEQSCRREGGVLVVRTTGRLNGTRVPRRLDSYQCSRAVRSMIRR